MRKEDLRLATGLTTDMIANMEKGKHISMETLTKIRTNELLLGGKNGF